MPLTLNIVLVLLAASAGWLIARMITWSLFRPLHKRSFLGYQWQGFIPASQLYLSQQTGRAIAGYATLSSKIRETLITEDMLRQLRPEIAAHVDVFMNDKMQHAFPLLYKYMGEKTLAKMKDAFLEEVELIFPQVLNSSVESWISRGSIAQAVETGIMELPVEMLEASFKKAAAAQLVKIRLMGAFAGLLLGLIQITLLFFLQR